MQLASLTKEAGELLRKVCSGRQLRLDDGHLLLQYQRMGGDGLFLSATLENEKDLQIWISESQWCRWIAPIFPAPDWAAIPLDLQNALSAWTLANAGIDENVELCWPNGTMLQPGNISIAPDWCLRIEVPGRRLDLRIVNAPIAWLNTIAELGIPYEKTETTLTPGGTDRVAHEMGITVGLIAGWIRVHPEIIDRLTIGDALLIQHAYRIADGEFGLFFNHPIAVVNNGVNQLTQTFIIEDVMNEFHDWLDIAPTTGTSLSENIEGNTDIETGAQETLLHKAKVKKGNITDNTMLSIVVEVASLQIPLHLLANLQKGDLLSGPARTDGLVTLRLAGRPIAQGILLDIDGWLAVKVENLM